MLVYQYLLTGWYICWKWDYNYYPKLTCEHTHDGSHDLTFVVRPITLTHVPLSDHLTSLTMLSLHRTTLAFPAQRTQQHVRHIARSIYISLHNARLMALQIVCTFVWVLFSCGHFIKQIANFFVRMTFWSHPLVQQLWKPHKVSVSVSLLPKCLLKLHITTVVGYRRSLASCETRLATLQALWVTHHGISVCESCNFWQLCICALLKWVESRPFRWSIFN